MNNKATILIIDDDIEIRAGIADYLTFEGYTTIEATNGEDGIELARQYKPDAIICDVMMPRMDGHSVLAELSKYKDTAHIPFIFLTARTSHQDLRQGMNLGADDYIFKPFDAQDLLQALKTRLEKAKRTRTTNPIYDDFVNMVAHELRTPLTGIQWATDAFEMYLDTMEPDDVKDMTNALRTSGLRMQRLVDQCVLHTEMQLGDFNTDILEINDLNILIMAATNEARNIAKSRASVPVHVSIEAADTTIVCHESVKIALREVIANALAASPEDGTVDVCAQYDTATHIWCITVQDDGEGMSPADAQQALMPFGKLKHGVYHEPGIGLGLTLAQSIITHHAGTLDITQDTNNRTTLTIKLPMPVYNKV